MMTTSTTTMSTNIIAVDAHAAKEAGAIVYFRSDGPTREADLLLATRDAGLREDILPSLPSAEVALSRAVGDHKAKRRLARPLEGGGWSLVDEFLNDNGEIDRHTVTLTVKFDKNTKDLVFSPEGHELEESVREAFREHKAQHSANDISSWLVQLASVYHHGVSPRDRGGFYFIPKQHLESFRAWAQVLRSKINGRRVSGSVVFFIPAMRSDEAVASILDAITREAEAEAEAMEAEIYGGDDSAESDGGDSSKLGKRAIKTRFRRLDAVGEKLSTYEELLGMKLDEVRTRLTQVRANLTVAQALADAVEES